MQETKREICTTHEHTEGKKSQVRISTPTLFSHCLLPCSACSAHTQGSAHGQYSKQLSSLPKRKKIDLIFSAIIPTPIAPHERTKRRKEVNRTTRNRGKTRAVAVSIRLDPLPDRVNERPMVQKRQKKKGEKKEAREGSATMRSLTTDSKKRRKGCVCCST